MTDISELYGIYLQPEHLPAEGVDTEIEKCSIESPLPGVKRAVIWLKNIARPLVLHDANADRLVDMASSTDTDKWIGVKVNLKPDGDTIVLDRPEGGPR